MSRKIRELAIPKYKKDWPGRTLLMKGPAGPVLFVLRDGPAGPF